MPQAYWEATAVSTAQFNAAANCRRVGAVCPIRTAALSAAPNSTPVRVKRMAITISSSFDAGNIKVLKQDGDRVDL